MLQEIVHQLNNRCGSMGCGSCDDDAISKKFPLRTGTPRSLGDLRPLAVAITPSQIVLLNVICIRYGVMV